MVKLVLSGALLSISGDYPRSGILGGSWHSSFSAGARAVAMGRARRLSEEEEGRRWRRLMMVVVDSCCCLFLLDFFFLQVGSR